MRACPFVWRALHTYAGAPGGHGKGEANDEGCDRQCNRRDDGGRVAGQGLTVTLQPGERRQLNQVLALAGASGSGWAELRRTSGAGRFVAYGVVNDNATGDGTVFRMVRPR